MGDTRHDGQMEINLSIYGAVLCLANPAGSAWIDAGRTVDHDSCSLTFFECFLSLSASEIRELTRGLVTLVCEGWTRVWTRLPRCPFYVPFVKTAIKPNRAQIFFFWGRVADQTKM